MRTNWAALGLLALPALAAQQYFVAKRLIDPATGRVIERAAVLVANGRILAAGPAASVPRPESAELIDFGDRVLIPGLVETHAHLYTYLLSGHTTNEVLPRLFLASGVTSVLVPGSSNPDGDFALRNRIDTGDTPGPRFFLAGEYLQMAPPDNGMKVLQTAAEAKLRIDQWAARGAAAVKLYNGVQGDILHAIVAHAHSRGLRVTAHLGATTYHDAVDAGVDVLYHGIYALPEITPAGMPPEAIGMIHFAPPDYDRFYRALADAALDAPAIRKMLAGAARAQVVFTPTAVALEPPDAALHHMAEQKRFYSAEAWAKVEKRTQAPARPLANALVKRNLAFVRLAHQAGVPVAAGTDLTNLQMTPGFALWRELELFREAGLAPLEVLKSATANGALALGRQDTIGSFRAGAFADFVVLNGDPLQNISQVRAVYRVVKSGAVHDPEVLLKPILGTLH